MGKTIKPICVIKVETKVFDNNFENLRQMQDSFEQQFREDYYVLCLPLYSDTEQPISVEVHFEKDFTRVKFEQLQKRIQSIMETSSAQTVEELLPIVLATPPDNTMAYKLFKYLGELKDGTWEWNMGKLESYDAIQLRELLKSLTTFTTNDKESKQSVSEQPTSTD